MPREVFEIPRGGLTCPVGSLTCLEHRRTYMPCRDFEVPQGGIFRCNANTRATMAQRECSCPVSQQKELQTLHWQDWYEQHIKWRRRFARATENYSLSKLNQETSRQRSQHRGKGNHPLERVQLGLCCLVHRPPDKKRYICDVIGNLPMKTWSKHQNTVSRLRTRG